MTPHHRFLLRLHLAQIDALDVAVREVEARLGEALAPFQAAVDRLMTIPAVGRTVARVIVAEIGFDMSRFPTAESTTNVIIPNHHRAGIRIIGPRPSDDPDAPPKPNEVDVIGCRIVDCGSRGILLTRRARLA